MKNKNSVKNEKELDDFFLRDLVSIMQDIYYPLLIKELKKRLMILLKKKPVQICKVTIKLSHDVVVLCCRTKRQNPSKHIQVYLLTLRASPFHCDNRKTDGHLSACRN